MWLLVTRAPHGQVISGTRGGLDIPDLRAHTNYSGGYNDGAHSLMSVPFVCTD